MIETINPKFNKMVGQRLQFSGVVDKATILNNGSKIQLTLLDVEERGTGDKFRDHLHIFLSGKEYKSNFKRAKNGELVEFTAIIEKYTKLPKNKNSKYFYQIENLGLTSFRKVQVYKLGIKKPDEEQLNERNKSLQLVVEKMLSKGYHNSISENDHFQVLTVYRNFSTEFKREIELDVENLTENYKKIYDQNRDKIIRLLTINSKKYVKDEPSKTEKLSELKLERLLVKDLKRYGLFL